MTKKLNTQDFPTVYKDLQINISKLGCVMLDLKPLPGSQKEKWRNLDLYTSKDPEKFWIKGWCADSSPHITLLYGLMKPAAEWEEFINMVLKGWEYKKAEIKDIGYFDSPYENEPYYCIIAHIKVTPELLEGHQRLELLPHINTFTGYDPHMTIAYIKKEKGIKYRDMVIEKLKDMWVGKTMEVKEILNLGKDK